MQDTIITCPCCGQRAAVKRPIVDLNANTVTWAGGTVSLTAQQAEIAAFLARHFDRAQDREAMVAAVYGQGESPEWASQLMSVRSSQIRKALRPIGLDVENIRGVGYRLTAFKPARAAA